MNKQHELQQFSSPTMDHITLPILKYHYTVNKSEKPYFNRTR